MKTDIVQCPKCKARLRVKRDEIDPEPIEVIAKSIIETAAAIRCMNASRLKRATLVALIHDHSKLGKRDIEIRAEQPRSTRKPLAETEIRRMTIETKFELKQEVYIPQLKVSGRVKAFSLTEIGGLQYQVRFFRETGHACNDHFFEDELTDKIPAAKQPAFAEAAR